MKTAISIPDESIRDGGGRARRLKISRNPNSSRPPHASTSRRRLRRCDRGLSQPERHPISRYIVVAARRDAHAPPPAGRCAESRPSPRWQCATSGRIPRGSARASALLVVSLAARGIEPVGVASRCRRADASAWATNPGWFPEDSTRARPGAAPRRAGRAADRRDRARGGPGARADDVPAAWYSARTARLPGPGSSASARLAESARAQAAGRSLWQRDDRASPVPDTATECSIGERAFTQSPLTR